MGEVSIKKSSAAQGAAATLTSEELSVVGAASGVSNIERMACAMEELAHSSKESNELAREGNRTLKKIERSPIPTVSIILVVVSILVAVVIGWYPAIDAYHHLVDRPSAGAAAPSQQLSPSVPNSGKSASKPHSPPPTTR